MELERVKDLSAEPLIVGSLITIPVIQPPSLLMKTMKNEVLEGEVCFRDYLSDLKIEAPEFDGDIKPENYINWVQAIKRIVELL